MAWGRPLAKYNLSATAAPAVTDDISLGYEISSLWVDVTGDEAYICVDNTDGAAVWISTTAPMPAATSRGQILYSTDGSTFTAQTPIASDDFGIILTEDDTGYIIVAA